MTPSPRAKVGAMLLSGLVVAAGLARGSGRRAELDRFGRIGSRSRLSRRAMSGRWPDAKPARQNRPAQRYRQDAARAEAPSPDLPERPDLPDREIMAPAEAPAARERPLADVFA